MLRFPASCCGDIRRPSGNVVCSATHESVCNALNEATALSRLTSDVFLSGLVSTQRHSNARSRPGSIRQYLLSDILLGILPITTPYPYLYPLIECALSSRAAVGGI